MLACPPAVGYYPGVSPNRFYAYYSSRRSAYYFFNPITNETVWERPTNAFVYFGETLEPFAETQDEYHKISNPLDVIAARERAKSARRSDKVRRGTIQLSSLTEIPVPRMRSTSGVFKEVLALSSVTGSSS